MADWRQHCGEHHVRRPSGLREVDNGGDGLGGKCELRPELYAYADDNQIA